MKNKWPERKAVLIIHEATTGPGHDLRDYLLGKKIGELLFISHPLIYLRDNYKKSSYYLYYKKGKLVKKGLAFHFILPEQLLYLKDVFYSIIWTMMIIKSVDLVVGFGNLNAVAGIILKFFRKTKKNVYYVIDYIPKRFVNSYINESYHWIEKTAAEKSDFTWNLSPRMIEAREKKWEKIFPNQLVVPHGVHIERIKHVPFTKVHKTEILYMGTILKKQGIQLVLKTIKPLAKKIKNIQFTIIGKGPYEPVLQALTKKLGIEKHVTFLGYVESHEEMENRIAQAGIAVALYDKINDSFSYYADPGKIKNYLGAGVPVIMTDVPFVARQVEKEKCGLIVKYNEKDLSTSLLKYFSDEKMMRYFRKNALEFASKYKWQDVFDETFAQMGM